MRAWIGKPIDEWRKFICGWSPSPDDPKCEHEAAWHGMVIGEDDLIAMMTCDDHLPVVTQLADYVHALVHPCGIEGSLFRWPENECYTQWDEQAEFAQAVTVGVEE